MLLNCPVLQVEHSVWERVKFPLGDMTKEHVRKVAGELGLHVASKKSSTGLCFVGKRRFSDFISQYLIDQPGQIRSVLSDHVCKN